MAQTAQFWTLHLAVVYWSDGTLLPP